MKPLDHYLSLKYRTSVYQDDEGDYIAEVDDLPGCVADGQTPDEAFANLEEAKRSWMESRRAAGLEIPEPRKLEKFSGKVLVRMPRFLHRRLSQQASTEGISLNQYVVSLLSQASAVPQGVASNAGWAGTGAHYAFGGNLMGGAQVWEDARFSTANVIRLLGSGALCAVGQLVAQPKDLWPRIIMGARFNEIEEGFESHLASSKLIAARPIHALLDQGVEPEAQRA
jgi:antitoxin HicB